MKKLFTIGTCLGVVILLSGCSIFSKPIVNQVSKVVVKYCTEPENQRMVYRQQINDKLSLYGHVVHAHCSGDSGEVIRND